MGKIFRDLIVALVNATLLLVVIGLFLAWQVTGRIENLVVVFAQNLRIVEPLRDDIAGATAELAALRGDLATLAAQSGELTSATLTRMQSRVEGVENRLETSRNQIASLAQAPSRLVDQAIGTAADEFTESVLQIRGCVPPET